MDKTQPLLSSKHLTELLLEAEGRTVKKWRMLLLSREVADPDELRPFMPSSEGFTHYVTIAHESDDRDEAIANLQGAALTLQDMLYLPPKAAE